MRVAGKISLYISDMTELKQIGDGAEEQWQAHVPVIGVQEGRAAAFTTPHAQSTGRLRVHAEACSTQRNTLCCITHIPAVVIVG